MLSGAGEFSLFPGKEGGDAGPRPLMFGDGRPGEWEHYS
jgi:hypothetical protein